MESGEKKDGRTATGLSLIVRELAVRLGTGGGGREQSCWRRSRYWVLCLIGQAEWLEGLVRQSLVEHLRHVVTASCGSHHPDTGADWPQPGWQNVGFSACLE